MDLAEEEITLRVELNDDNILLNSTVFYAVDAYYAGVSSESRSMSTNTGIEISHSGDMSFMFLKFKKKSVYDLYLFQYFCMSICVAEHIPCRLCV